MEHKSDLIVMMVKWKTFLLTSPAVIFVCQKQKLQTPIQTVLLTYSKLDSGWK
jgi:hypothetical protein